MRIDRAFDNRGGKSFDHAIAVNIARDWAQDTTLARIADRLFNENLDVKIFEEAPRKGRSALIVATKQATGMNEIAAIASSLGFRATLR